MGKPTPWGLREKKKGSKGKGFKEITQLYEQKWENPPPWGKGETKKGAEGDKK